MTWAWTAAPAGAALVAALLLTNARIVGFLPDDPPGGRKRHRGPLPMAGIALAVVATAILALTGSQIVALGALLCGAVGYLDDRGKERRSEFPVLAKILLLGIAAMLGASSATGLEIAALWTWLLVVAFAFIITNAINFLDNSNGVAAAVGGLGLVLANGGAGPHAAIGFLFLGFLPLNWPWPRALLGDAGALCLGYCLAVTALQNGVTGNVIGPAVVAPVAVPLLDFVQVVCARLWLGFAPWIGDRRHLTHIAMNSGLPHALVAPVFALLAAGLFAALR